MRGGSTVEAAALLTHERLLGQRLLLHIKARFVVAPAIVAAALIGHSVLGIDGLEVRSLTLVAGFIAAYNVAILRVAWSRCDPEHAAEHRRVLRRLFRGSMVLDFLALTIVVWLVGGARSPFLAFYLFHVVITSLLLSRTTAMIAVATASVLLSTLVLCEYFGLIPARMPVGAVMGGGPIDGRYALTLVLVYPTLFVLVGLLLTSLVQALRRAEADIQSKTIELQKLSTMRQEFLRVALHDINSPVGVVSMLVGNMRQGLCGPLDQRQQDQLDRALKQLGGIDALLKDLRLLSELDTTDLAEHSIEVSLAFLLDEVIEEHADLAAAHRHTLRTEPGEGAALVFGVPRLLKEAIVNYVTNAIKYTPDGGTIVARVLEREEFVRLEVSDNGIGISAGDQQRLFQEFTRLGRSNPHTSKVRGAGLGLSLVRRIAEMHGGTVGARSRTGEGSTFWLELPACRRTPDVAS
ncbi:MAG: sensor histidine kinase [Leptolyngbya sp. PLA3]|nr:MAG: sensor histidine kinase [Cyanobacteria bacterium CYA]MCE7967763.1 sensor histidine kinase [Leptolyngbya sp. PL-A3]